ncbi:8-amino-7-oxononanoate synthase [Aureisphaera galaxeae]|uniref:aminotransferase class I/II-fold pyridoxal phosphate-dependent enzyme n=1 Tax=Aureisphaera galaxeae TaxID=1538023 RepID=UPI002350734F|nr:8-amino-7-oxononanoate synthase [Aureisphaera galaxeae]MDC8002690.1 8-amino-7-oxononanoate synthase [Aureisphaera galaxeae]
MKGLPGKLQQKLSERNENGSLRQLGVPNDRIDFSSNDYLGFANSEVLFDRAEHILVSHNLKQNGATGSRLLSGNHELYEIAEKTIAQFHEVASALIFNSGYDANVGIFSSIPQRGDIILYDELCHASIRDGIRMSHAKAYKFDHNDLTHLEQLCQRHQAEGAEIYVVTESVFSMDGDAPDLKALVAICKKHNALCIVDEAHALGVVGKRGVGAVQDLNLQDSIFARVVTFGKGLGVHGAAVLGSKELKTYLLNFARSFVYTTGLPPHSVAAIQAGYTQLKENSEENSILHSNIAILRNQIEASGLSERFIDSQSAIHSMILPGNKQVKAAAAFLAENGLDVKPILSPTVPQGQERLRICVHSFNSEADIRKLVQQLATFTA